MQRARMFAQIKAGLDGFHTFLNNLIESDKKVSAVLSEASLKNLITAVIKTDERIRGRYLSVRADINQRLQELWDIEDPKKAESLDGYADCPDCGNAFKQEVMDLEPPNSSLKVGICSYCRSLQITAAGITD